MLIDNEFHTITIGEKLGNRSLSDGLIDFMVYVALSISWGKHPKHGHKKWERAVSSHYVIDMQANFLMHANYDIHDIYRVTSPVYELN